MKYAFLAVFRRRIVRNRWKMKRNLHIKAVGHDQFHNFAEESFYSFLTGYAKFVCEKLLKNCIVWYTNVWAILYSVHCTLTPEPAIPTHFDMSYRNTYSGWECSSRYFHRHFLLHFWITPIVRSPIYTLHKYTEK